jgi:hypothetical protein
VHDAIGVMHAKLNHLPGSVKPEYRERGYRCVSPDRPLSRLTQTQIVGEYNRHWNMLRCAPGALCTLQTARQGLALCAPFVQEAESALV